jgi:subtilisin-like proprotein convertase family protein
MSIVKGASIRQGDRPIYMPVRTSGRWSVRDAGGIMDTRFPIRFAVTGIGIMSFLLFGQTRMAWSEPLLTVHLLDSEGQPVPNGHYFDMAEPATPVSVELVIAGWDFPEAGRTVQCRLDGLWDGETIGSEPGPQQYEFQDLPVGMHQLCCSLAADGIAVQDCAATGCVDVRITRPCDGDGDPVCDDGNPCSVDECVTIVPNNVWECRYSQSPDPLCCNSSYDCFCADGMRPVCKIVGTVPQCSACDNDADCNIDSPCPPGICTGGLCGPDLDNLSCDDGLLCTIDVCFQALCRNVLVEPPDCCVGAEECDDGNPCRTNWQCLDNSCEFEPAAPGGDDGCCEEHTDCGEGGAADDGDPATIDYCQDNQCQHVPNPYYCGDDSFCEDGNDCTVDQCNADNECVHEEIPGCCTEDSDCDDSDFCTLDSCDDQNSTCVYTGNPQCCELDTDCFDDDSCTEDFCVEQLCANIPIPECCLTDLDCIDPDVCTSNECEDNVCVFPDIPDCQPCTVVGDCDDDGSICTIEYCIEGMCRHIVENPQCCLTDAECDDYNFCTCDSCEEGICHNHPADNVNCWLPDDCCVDDYDCDPTPNPCEINQCSIGNTCEIAPVEPCSVQLPYQENFNYYADGNLEGIGWNAIDFDEGIDTTLFWGCSDEGLLGPDIHARFADFPAQAPFSTFLLSPPVDMVGAGVTRVTVRLDYDYADNPESTGSAVLSLVSIPESADLTTVQFEQVVGHNAMLLSDDMTAESVFFTVDHDPPSQYLRVGVGLMADDGEDLLWLDIDNVKVCPGFMPEVVSLPDSPSVKWNDSLITSIVVEDLDVDNLLDATMESGPDFVSITEIQETSDTGWTIELSVEPDSPADIGEHMVQINVSDGCLVIHTELKISVMVADGYLVWNPSEELSGYAAAIATAVSDSGRPVQVVDELDFFAPDFQDILGVFVVLGVNNDPSYILDQDLSGNVDLLADYLDEGGRIYLESGNNWATDPWTRLHYYFGVKDSSVGLEPFTGPVKGFNFQHELAYDVTGAGTIDSLIHNNNLGSIPVLVPDDETANTVLTIAFEEPLFGFRTIASSLPFSTLVDNGQGTPGELMESYLSFFESGWPLCTDDPQCNDGNECTTESCEDGICIVETQLCECDDDSDCPQGQSCEIKAPSAQCGDVPGYIYYSTDTPVWMGEGEPPVSKSSTIYVSVPDDRLVKDVNVRVHLDHPAPETLILRLFHEAEDAILRKNDNSSPTNSTYDYGLDLYENESLDVFNDTLTSGYWHLGVIDSAGPQIGSLVAWELILMECSVDTAAQDCDDGDSCTIESCEMPAGLCVSALQDHCEGKECTDHPECGNHDYCDKFGDQTCKPIPGIEYALEGEWPLDIPDSQAEGMESSVDISMPEPGEPGLIVKANLKVVIIHPDVSELSVTLEHSDESLVLHSSGGSSAGNLAGVYELVESSSSPESDMSTFNGSEIFGTWKLKVVDEEAGNAGVLQWWSLHVDLVECWSDADCSEGSVCLGGSCCQTDCDGKECGDDGCNGDCGLCSGPKELCNPELGLCECEPDCEGKECGPDGCGGTCGECDDQLFCNGTEYCNYGVCVVVEIPEIDDGYTCTDDICYEQNDEVLHVPDHSSCDDGNPCTVIYCVGYGGDPITGCLIVDNDGMDCSDTDLCNGGEECFAGECLPGPPLGCDNNDICDGIETCDPDIGCLVGTSLHCDDEYACTIDICDPATGCHNLADDEYCVDNHPVDENPCTVAECNPDSGDPVTGCMDVAITDGPLTEDDNGCTENEYCDGGTYTYDDVLCDDTIPCTEDVCDPAKLNNGEPCDGVLCCVHTAIENHPSCDDGTDCTIDVCNIYFGCEHSADNGQCDDGNVCTDDVCSPETGCENIYNSATCDDGDMCTTNDVCQNGQCQPGPESLDCDDGNACTDDSCDSIQGCQNTDNSAACDDGDACTVGDTCYHGGCFPGLDTLSCSDYNICTDDSCDPDSGCVFTNNTVACDDTNDCTVGDVCMNGTCAAGSDVPDCDDGNPCTADPCINGFGCQSHPDDGLDCDDGDPCTVDECSDGECVGEFFCNDHLDCTEDSCTDGICEHQVLEDSCLIDGVCFASGEISPSIPCRQCLPSLTQTEWSIGDDPVFCEPEEICLDGQCYCDQEKCGDVCCPESEVCTDAWDSAAEIVSCGATGFLQISGSNADDAFDEVDGYGDYQMYEAPEVPYRLVGPSAGDTPVRLTLLKGEKVKGQFDLFVLDAEDKCTQDFKPLGNNFGLMELGMAQVSFIAQANHEYLLVVDGFVPLNQQETKGSFVLLLDCDLHCGNGECEPEVDENCNNCNDCAANECGNACCDNGETWLTCPGDCGLCGNGNCDGEETCNTCSIDCGSCCGNQICEIDFAEDCGNCPSDCGTCCGNGECGEDETCSTCPVDCGVCGCPNGECGEAENCNTCPQDCGECCGNDICDFGETCNTCSEDCGTCCGNSQCDYEETCETCMEDCGPCCGNGECDFDETPITCAEDCGSCGNGVCNAGPPYWENYLDCTQDCNASCGDGACSTSAGEDCYLCPQDCSSQNCGDEICQVLVGENYYSCPDDCGPHCGNLQCQQSVGEHCYSCPIDCQPACGLCSDAAGPTAQFSCDVDYGCVTVFPGPPGYVWPEWTPNAGCIAPCAPCSDPEELQWTGPDTAHQLVFSGAVDENVHVLVCETGKDGLRGIFVADYVDAQNWSQVACTTLSSNDDCGSLSFDAQAGRFYRIVLEALAGFNDGDFVMDISCSP